MDYETAVFPRATLYLGDFLALQPLGLLRADVIVTDPPYGISYQHSGGGKGVAKSSTATIHGDNKPFDPQPLLDFGVPLLMFGADHYRDKLPSGGSFLAWDKHVGVGGADSFVDCEFAWSSAKVKRNIYRHLWKGCMCAGEDSPIGVFGKSSVKRHHVSQKPRELMRWCIETLRPKPDSVILDPYMGSGSTGVAALSLGHRFVGVEIDRGHFETACQRIDDATRQMGLFLCEEVGAGDTALLPANA